MGHALRNLTVKANETEKGLNKKRLRRNSQRNKKANRMSYHKSQGKKAFQGGGPSPLQGMVLRDQGKWEVECSLHPALWGH